MSKIKYKINGYWHEIKVEGKIEDINYENEEPSVLEINVSDTIKAETGLA